MLVAGDEAGRTQQGNNNAYCRDNEISWLDWKEADRGLHDFVRRLIALRREHPTFRRRRWFHGRDIHGERVHDFAWFTVEGHPMSEEHWGEGFAKTLSVWVNGDSVGARGGPVADDTFFVLFNAHHEPLPFTILRGGWGRRWTVVIDTRHDVVAEGPDVSAGEAVVLEGRSLMLLRRAD